jgi:hypothetical protein
MKANIALFQLTYEGGLVNFWTDVIIFKELAVKKKKINNMNRLQFFFQSEKIPSNRIKIEIPL